MTFFETHHRDRIRGFRRAARRRRRATRSAWAAGSMRPTSPRRSPRPSPPSTSITCVPRRHARRASRSRRQASSGPACPSSWAAAGRSRRRRAPRRGRPRVRRSSTHTTAARADAELDADGRTRLRLRDRAPRLRHRDARAPRAAPGGQRDRRDPPARGHRPVLRGVRVDADAVLAGPATRDVAGPPRVCGARQRPDASCSTPRTTPPARSALARYLREIGMRRRCRSSSARCATRTPAAMLRGARPRAPAVSSSRRRTTTRARAPARTVPSRVGRCGTSRASRVADHRRGSCGRPWATTASVCVTGSIFLVGDVLRALESTRAPAVDARRGPAAPRAASHGETRGSAYG